MENPPLEPLEQTSLENTAQELSSSHETLPPPLVSPEQLQQLGKEAYQAVIEKNGEPQKSQFEELSESYFEKRHEKLNEPEEPSYSGELTPVGEILSKRSMTNSDNLKAKPESSDDMSSTHHGGAAHSLATDYKRILAAAIITGIIVAIVGIIWLAK